MKLKSANRVSYITPTNAQLVPVFPGHVDPLMCIVGWSYMNYGVLCWFMIRPQRVARINCY